MQMSRETDVAAALGAEAGPPFVIAAANWPVLSLPRYIAGLRLLEKVRVADFNKGLAARIDDGQGFPTFAELLVASRLRALRIPGSSVTVTFFIPTRVAAK